MYELSKTIVHDRLQAAERARLGRQARLRSRTRDGHAAADPLRRLLARTDALSFGAVAAWTEIRTAAAAVRLLERRSR